MARIAAVTAFCLLALFHSTMSITVQEFFPEAKSNLTKIKWSHATNSQEALKKALDSSDVHMIEADVVMGTLKTNPPNNNTMPIMGHPPANSSDLSLADFLKQVTANKKKGIKLDFKSIEAFKAAIPEIQALGNVTVPLWLNADILKGPVNATDEPKPVDAAEFLKEAAKLPQTLLSIGWTTRLEETTANVTSGKYLTEQIDAMVKVIQDQKVNQSVTYPVRACFAANDVEVLQKLLSSTKANNPTLTIWSSEGDKVDAAKLSTVIKTVGLDKVFVDVPQTLWAQLHLANSAFTAKSSFSVLLASMLVALSAVKLL
ncbi:protein FAM151A isoform X2 [Nasonia vitripennis]|uniref:Menorin-like domain-containing protein n=1 Tax=Nasonia vitripennis TaxID=7425 RepID=A0A7M7ILL9_NASVI|nr:protein FAM151A isoform X2 [Nasonia vitripennis]